MSYGHENFAATASEDYIYVFGGWNSVCERYDPTANSWSYLPSTPGWTSTGGADAVFLNGYLWSIGGSGKASIGHLLIDNADGTSSSSWVQKTSMSVNRGYGIQGVAVRVLNAHGA